LDNEKQNSFAKTTHDNALKTPEAKGAESRKNCEIIDVQGILDELNA